MGSLNRTTPFTYFPSPIPKEAYPTSSANVPQAHGGPSTTTPVNAPVPVIPVATYATTSHPLPPSATPYDILSHFISKLVSWMSPPPGWPALAHDVVYQPRDEMFLRREGFTDQHLRWGVRWCMRIQDAVRARIALLERELRRLESDGEEQREEQREREQEKSKEEGRREFGEELERQRGSEEDREVREEAIRWRTRVELMAEIMVVIGERDELLLEEKRVRERLEALRK